MHRKKLRLATRESERHKETKQSDNYTYTALYVTSSRHEREREKMYVCWMAKHAFDEWV